MGRRRLNGDAAHSGTGDHDVSNDLKPFATESLNAPPTRVYVGRVPSSLCLHEPGIRQLFEPFGSIESITIHHDALNMGADGFLFLEFRDADAARAAVAAVTQADETNDTWRFEGMCARLAVARGTSLYVPDASVVDLLLGRRQVNHTNLFSQHSTFMSQHDEPDEDELILQSLSQRTTRRSSQSATTKKRKKRSSSRHRHGSDDENERDD